VANHFHTPAVVKPVQHVVSSADCARSSTISQNFAVLRVNLSAIASRRHANNHIHRPSRSRRPHHVIISAAYKDKMTRIDNVRDQPDDSMGEDDDGANAFTVDDATNNR